MTQLDFTKSSQLPADISAKRRIIPIKGSATKQQTAQGSVRAKDTGCEQLQTTQPLKEETKISNNKWETTESD